MGLDHDICQIYEFISNNYETGDELFFFGFSRGAFTVRSVAGLVCDVGVLSAVGMSRFGEMWKAYRENTSGQSFRESTWYKDNETELGLGKVKVKVVGVWDTVGAMVWNHAKLYDSEAGLADFWMQGVPEWPAVGWLQKVGVPVNKQYAFHNTKVSASEYRYRYLQNA